METETFICTNCRCENPINHDTCVMCGTPQGEVVPPKMEQLFSGNVHYQAVNRPQKFIVVFGVCLILSPMAIALGFNAISFLLKGTFIYAAINAFFSLLVITIIINAARNYFKNKKIEQEVGTDNED